MTPLTALPMAMQFRIWATVLGSWAEDRQWAVLEPLLLPAKVDHLGREIGCLAGVPRGAGGLAEVAPCWHSTRTSRLCHTRIWVYPGGKAHIAGHDFQRIGAARRILWG